MKTKKELIVRIAIIFCAALVLVMAVLQCRDKIRKELQVQMIQNLHDVASQNVMTLEKELEDKQNLLASTAKELQIYPDTKPEQILQVLRPLTEIYHFKRIGFIYPNGETYTTDGFHQNLAFRSFFQKSLLGEAFITGALKDAIGVSEDINVFSVPVYGKNDTEVTGVLFATYQTKMFQQLLNVESFNGAGFSYVIQTDGTIVAQSTQSPMYGHASNLFNYLLEANDTNHEAVEQIQDNIRLGLSNNTHFHMQKDYYVYYMPLTSTFDGQKSYMLTIVPSETLTQRTSPVLRYINLLLVSIFCILAISCIFYIHSYSTSRKNLLRLAYEDPLTKGDNFACFKNKMKKAVQTAGYIISVDISEFKIINHTCGVEKGDETIQKIWDILQRNIHENELAAHRNADHYVLFLIEEEKENLLTRLQLITSEICHLTETLNIPRLFPYFGIYPTDGDISVEAGYNRANEAKHLVKGNHTVNYAFYDEVDFEQTVENKKLEDAFESALANNEFEVWYQPKYSTSNSQIVAAEALIRWRKKDGTLIPPYKFIPLFEKNGMISMLDDYVFHTVCARQEQWQNERKPLFPISVNISRATLNVLHFDVIKLDKSLIDYIGDNKGEKLLWHTIRLAKDFGMSITAEGVERLEQLQFLQKLDCDDIQGYYFSKPLPFMEYQALLYPAGN